MAGKILKKKPAKPLIAVVGRNQLQMCGQDSGQPVGFTFTDEFIKDLDVINPEVFGQKIADFIVENKLKPAPVIVIFLDNVYFEKNFPGSATPGPDDVQQFLDTIPLSAISYKVFHTADGYKLIVINQELYEIIKKTFESQDFPIQAVIPGFALNLINVSPELTAQSCLLISKKSDFLIENSFTAPSMNEGDFHQKEQAFLQKHTALVVILSVMFIATALVVAFITLQRPKPKLVTVIPKPVVTPVVSVSPTPEIASVSSQLLSGAVVRVVNASGRAGAAASLAAQLKSAGLTNTTVQTSPLITGSPFLVYKQDLPQVLVEHVRSVLVKSYPQIDVRSQSTQSADLIITLTR